MESWIRSLAALDTLMPSAGMWLTVRLVVRDYIIIIETENPIQMSVSAVHSFYIYIKTRCMDRLIPSFCQIEWQ